MFIVTPNYNNRGSEYCWLIRDASSPQNAGRACKRVVASNVEFQPTYDGNFPLEVGFGCSMVAVCDQAEGFDFEDEAPAEVDTNVEGLAKLHFDGASFVQQGKVVTKLEGMTLAADRSMFGTVAV